MRGTGIAVFVVLAGLGAPGQAAAPIFTDGEFKADFGNLEWAPKCTRPWSPPGRSAFGRAQYRYQARGYMDCIDRQARSDSQAAVDAVKAGREKAYAELLAEIRAAP